jgi:hypothetical protein
VSEISFINQLEAQNKKIEVQERYQVSTYIRSVAMAAFRISFRGRGGKMGFPVYRGEANSHVKAKL